MFYFRNTKPETMHKNLRSLLSLLAVMVILSSCGKKSPKEAKYIPKDATVTFVVNPKSLEDKMKKGNLSIDSFVKKVQNNGDTLKTADKQEWEDFKNSGVSLEDNFFLFVVQKGSMQKGQTNVVNFLGTLKDESKFEAYAKKQKKLKEKTIAKGNGYSYIINENNNILAWNKEVIMVSMYQANSRMEFDSLGNYKIVDNSSIEADMKKEVDRYFTQKESESVASLEPFNNMFKESADGYMFSTSAGALAALSATPLNLPKLQELLKDNYSTTTFNFEDGKIVAKGTTYANPMLSSILKKYAGPTVNISAIEKFPSQNINGAMLASFNPELFNGMLKELEVSGMIDGFLSRQGLTSADIFKALKGEINVVVGDFSIGQQTRAIPMPDGSIYNATSEQPMAKMVLTASIGDKVAFSKLMDKAVEGGAVVKDGNSYAAGPLLKIANLYLHVDDKNFALASDSLTYAAYIAGTGKANIATDVLDKMKGKATAAFVDINSILKGTMPSIKDATSTKVLSIVNSTFKDMFLTVDNFSGSTLKSEAELRMADGKQNSLVSIMNMVTNIYTIVKEEQKNRMAQYNQLPAPPMDEAIPSGK